MNQLYRKVCLIVSDIALQDRLADLKFPLMSFVLGTLSNIVDDELFPPCIPFLKDVTSHDSLAISIEIG